jgi:signal peptidase II|tara:strand:+ start:165 stop:656 length:492 start_codon:yes stop_codon:yes gene_type:complete
MIKINYKSILLNLIVVLIIFLLDRSTKIYILKMVELENIVDIYLTQYLNLYFIWNKGIAFGLFSFDNSTIYSFITFVIAIINIIILLMIIKSEGFKKYSLMLVLGGSLGNLFDRVYFGAVPDFIDLHINNFHWFIFNVADIFITLGVICLIYDEVFFNKGKNE